MAAVERYEDSSVLPDIGTGARATGEGLIGDREQPERAGDEDDEREQGTEGKEGDDCVPDEVDALLRKMKQDNDDAAADLGSSATLNSNTPLLELLRSTNRSNEAAMEELKKCIEQAASSGEAVQQLSVEHMSPYVRRLRRSGQLNDKQLRHMASQSFSVEDASAFVQRLTTASSPPNMSSPTAAGGAAAGAGAVGGGGGHGHTVSAVSNFSSYHSTSSATGSTGSGIMPPPNEDAPVVEGGKVVVAEGGMAGERGNASLSNDPAPGGQTEVGREGVGAPTIGPAVPFGPALEQIVLKFTTMSEGMDMPSFVVTSKGAKIGRSAAVEERGEGEGGGGGGEGKDREETVGGAGAGVLALRNDIVIPNDDCMRDFEHASIDWKGGVFSIQDKGQSYGAAIRIGMGVGLRDWPLEKGSTFSAGNSVFLVSDFDEEGAMMLDIIAGPLKGERRRVLQEGATVGRASENSISIADRELSRKHSRVEWHWVSPEDVGPNGAQQQQQQQQQPGSLASGRFFLCDVGSTNGTYMQLVGPYASNRVLSLSDHILVGRTGFSINRFDWGIWEERGMRRTMEDKSIVIQDMAIEVLNCMGLGPQSYMAVYDGHGGAEASAFLWAHLHVNLADALERAAPLLKAAQEEDERASSRAIIKEVEGREAGGMAGAPSQGGANTSTVASGEEGKGEEGGGGGGGGGGAAGCTGKGGGAEGGSSNSIDDNGQIGAVSVSGERDKSEGGGLQDDSPALDAPPPPSSAAPAPTVGMAVDGGAASEAMARSGEGYESSPLSEQGETPTAVDEVMRKVVTDCYLAADQQFLTSANQPQCGSTATTAMVLGDRFYSFNVGDSRLLLCAKGKCRVVSQDHKPNREDETERIKRAGGLVINKRVMGELAVSRAFGDREFKMGIQAILSEEGLGNSSSVGGGTGAGASTGGSGGSSGGVEGEGRRPSDASDEEPANGEGESRNDQEKEEQEREGKKEGAGEGSNKSGGCSGSGGEESGDKASGGRTEPRLDKPLITAEPEMLCARLTTDDEFALLACDGLFDVFSNEEVVEVIREEMARHGDAQRTCEVLTEKAISERYTRDNVTIVLVVLNRWW